MFWPVLKQLEAPSPAWLQRVSWRALMVSVVAHAGAIGFASTFYLAGRDAASAREKLETNWSPPEIERDISSTGTVVEVPSEISNSDPGGRSSSSPQPLELAGPVAGNRELKISANLLESPVPSWSRDLADTKDLARIVGPQSTGSGSGNGTGDGHGDGSGSGGRFFETRAAGKRFVFVVDCSQSMNHPDPSEYKTRFNRLKVELARSITQMDAASAYFIIFFNDRTHPMPATSLQGAQSESRARIFEWLGTVRAEGKTDPRPALKMALAMRPDVVYFLTDGDFLPGIGRDLDRLAQRGVVIHTFAFGNMEAEAALKGLAVRNGGHYTFVP